MGFNYGDLMEFCGPLLWIMVDFVILLVGNPPLGESKGAISSNTKKTNKVGEHQELKLGWLRLVGWIACVGETMGRLKI